MTKIAIIEDDPAISQMYRMKLESDNFEVSIAGNGEQGIELVKQVLPDIILLDLMMPGMSGHEALIKIRSIEELELTPVIILTNREFEKTPDYLEKLNVADYIVKANNTPSEVVKKVQKVLE